MADERGEQVGKNMAAAFATMHGAIASGWARSMWERFSSGQGAPSVGGELEHVAHARYKAGTIKSEADLLATYHEYNAYLDKKKADAAKTPDEIRAELAGHSAIADKKTALRGGPVELPPAVDYQEVLKPAAPEEAEKEKPQSPPEPSELLSPDSIFASRPTMVGDPKRSPKTVIAPPEELDEGPVDWMKWIADDAHLSKIGSGLPSEDPAVPKARATVAPTVPAEIPSGLPPAPAPATEEIPSALLEYSSKELYDPDTGRIVDKHPDDVTAPAAKPGASAYEIAKKAEEMKKLAAAEESSERGVSGKERSLLKYLARKKPKELPEKPPEKPAIPTIPVAAGIGGYRFKDVPATPGQAMADLLYGVLSPDLQRGLHMAHKVMGVIDAFTRPRAEADSSPEMEESPSPAGPPEMEESPSPAGPPATMPEPAAAGSRSFTGGGSSSSSWASRSLSPVPSGGGGPGRYFRSSPGSSTGHEDRSFTFSSASEGPGGESRGAGKSSGGDSDLSEKMDGLTKAIEKLTKAMEESAKPQQGQETQTPGKFSATGAPGQKRAAEKKSGIDPALIRQGAMFIARAASMAAGS